MLLTGVRQCGKTFVLKEFGERYFDNTVYLNFEENERLVHLFEYNLDNELDWLRSFLLVSKGIPLRYSPKYQHANWPHDGGEQHKSVGIFRSVFDGSTKQSSCDHHEIPCLNGSHVLSWTVTVYSLPSNSISTSA